MTKEDSAMVESLFYVKELGIRNKRFLGRKNCAIGGRLVGADGGGSLVFYSDDALKLRETVFKAELSEVRFRSHFEGTKVTP